MYLTQVQIFKADFSCPPWFSTSAKKLIKRILDPSPTTVSSLTYFPLPDSYSFFNLCIFLKKINKIQSQSELQFENHIFLIFKPCIIMQYICKQRITIQEVIENEWFKKGYQQPRFVQEDVSLDDVDAIFNETGVSYLLFLQSTLEIFLLKILCINFMLTGLVQQESLIVERREERPAAPVPMNAFELISKSQGLNLSSLFEKQMVCLYLQCHTVSLINEYQLKSYNCGAI